MAEATPVMGGQGLKEWQRVKCRAYENSWSLVERLAELERENALLRRENDMMRKVRYAEGSSMKRGVPGARDFSVGVMYANKCKVSRVLLGDQVFGPVSVQLRYAMHDSRC